MKQLYLLVLLLSSCAAQVAFNNTNTMSNTAGNTVSESMSVTAGGSNLVAVVPVVYDHSAGASCSAVTYAGASMTAVCAAACNSNSNSCVQWWVLANPSTGSNTLAITCNSNTNEIYTNLISFTGANQSTPVRSGSCASANGNSTAPSVTVSSNSSDKTVSTIDSGGPSISVTPTNQTSDGTNSGGANAAGSDHETGTASSVTHTWTLNGTGQWVISGLSIQVAGGSSSPASFNKQRKLEQMEGVVR